MGNEFFWFLLAGLVILAVLLAIFNWGFLPEQPKGGGEPVTPVPSGEKQLNQWENWVGLKNVETYRAIPLGDVDTSYLSGEKTTTALDKNIFSGLLFGSNSLKIDVARMADYLGAYIEFDIQDTNNYGALVITLDGNAIARDYYGIGNHRILLGNISENSRVEIYAESSLWKIWAPAQYNLKNIKVVEQSLYSRPQEFSFMLYDEYDTMTQAFIDLNLDTRSGELITEINGNQVAKDFVPRNFYRVVATKPVFVKGENIITFRSEQNSNFTGTASMTVYYMKEMDLQYEYQFNLSKSQYANLSEMRSKITFNIAQKTRDGAFSVKLNGKRLCKNTCYPEVQLGNWTFYYNKSTAKVGTNSIVISSVDNALFQVRNMTVYYYNTTSADYIIL